ncbi:sodium/glutamate symporter [Kaarinaea lacus]
MEHVLSPRQTIIIAILVLYLGKYLNRKIDFFREFNIPEPVTGGVLVSLILGAVYAIFNVYFEFALEERDNFLIIFFTCIGLSSRISTLLEGGRALVILIVLAVCYLVLQNFTGLAVISTTELNSAVGLIGGSVSLSGGHGTAIAWAPLFIEQYGITNAMEIGVACATFGLVLGGVIGGPIAKYLIQKYQLESISKEHITVGIPQERESESIDVNSVLNAILIIGWAVGLGIELNSLLEYFGLKLPMFVTCLFAGIVMTNTIPLMFKRITWPTGKPTLALISDLSLGLFLAMSLMSLQLWTLIDLAGPIILLLIAQVLVVTLFVIFLVFRFMGKNYDAAVMSAGYAGLALGATPTAIANMTAVVEKYGASPQAFLVVPLVGAFFIDIANSLILNFLLGFIN